MTATNLASINTAQDPDARFDQKLRWELGEGVVKLLADERTEDICLNPDSTYDRNEHIMPLDRETFNREVSGFINAISHKNLIFTHHSPTISKDNKPTSRTKPMSSFSKLGHYVSVEIEMTRDDDDVKRNQEPRRPEDKPMESVYTMTVKDCQAHPELVGLDGE
jgi:hypothetical protein